ncbi:sensor histidine kinase [Geothermobacter hydrogeniphilus]|uniref:histidine kinase n=1 Tax=Geothermobacter hydrogeniphilus TaxID=1969733 RepID=A0A1X0YDT2_9BACT|nr:ATP-binding protein [Geothermobacter hydrogeniphilus]ORJ63365.1 hypothetical protein B5V00_00435 [Geothermobacter hydrogeniphilus]
MSERENIDYVVGEEKRLIDLLTGDDVMPLLQAACRAGASRVEVRDAAQGTLWDHGLSAGSVGSGTLPGFVSAAEELLVEGEPVGDVRLLAPESCAGVLKTILALVGGALNTVITSNLKRMLTTEIHTRVINQSYDELLAINARLTESERNYRELAENLETRVQQRTAELKQAYAGLVAQQQMASVGRLAAGVAHEINNPLGFVHSNLHSLQTYLQRLVEMLRFYRARYTADGETVAEAEALWRKLKLDFILEDLDDLFRESIDGAERVKSIVSDLKSFSHIDALGAEKIELDVEVDRALGLLAHETPPGTRIVRDYRTITPVTCVGGQLSQVLLNLLRNALQSRREGLLLEVATGFSGDQVWLSIADNGSGIPEELRSRVFEPFFTTREVGGGIGLGLTVVHNILEQWGGRVDISSRPEGGTRVEVCWPRGADDG